jgi:hypothetical protein
LESPEGFCYDGSGRFCVAGNVLGKGWLQIDGSYPPQVFPIYERPESITLGPDGRIYGTSNRHTETGITGVVRFEEHTPSTFISGLQQTWDIRFGPDASLYLTEDPFLGSARVLRFDGVTGAPLGVFASGGGLSGAGGMTFGPDGDLYVTSWATHSVLRFAAVTGSFKSEFVPAGSGGIRNPIDLEFGEDGRLYVLGSGIIRRYDGATGAYIDAFATMPHGGGSVLGFMIPEPTAVFVLVLSPLCAPRLVRRCRRLGR